MKPSIFQPQHDGSRVKPKAGPALTTTHSPGRAKEHDVHVAYGAEHQYSGNIDPRVGGKPKHDHDLQIHGGMVSKTKNGALAFGGDHCSMIDANPPASMNTIPEGKAFIGQSVPAAFGMRSRSGVSHDTNCQLGKAILDAAYSAGSPDDRMCRLKGK